MSTGSSCIVVHITTSSSVFDLSQPATFKIALSLTLKHASPITFVTRYTSLFDGKLLHQGGLTFTNRATGQQVLRNTLDICYLLDSGDRGPSWTTRSEYVTLYPDREHIINVMISPVKRKSPRPDNHFKKNGVPCESPKWFGLWGFENKQTYEIGISEVAAVKERIEGSIWEILGWQMLGWTPEWKRDEIRYTVLEPAIFKVKSPDIDGSLNWP
ncbi:Nn.00g042960.m01.CDS01 [Neocucurbitaria sp. VM-36]